MERCPPDKRQIALAWMSNWQYANVVLTMQYRSSNSVPRDLGLYVSEGETYLKNTPSVELWDMIIAEFRFAAENLPDDNEDVGRANKGMAQAYLAKALLYAAYEQDEQHNVTGIDQSKLQEVVTLCQGLSSKYSLVDDFANNLLCETEPNFHS